MQLLFKNLTKLKMLIIFTIIIFSVLSTSSNTHAAENKLRIEYTYVTESQLNDSQKENLIKDFKNLTATSSAHYLMVVKPTDPNVAEGENGSNISAITNENNNKLSVTNDEKANATTLLNKSTPQTNDNRSFYGWFLLFVVTFLISPIIYKSKMKKLFCFILIASMSIGIPISTLENAFAFKSIDLSKYNTVKYLNINDKLFDNLPEVSEGKVIGVVKVNETNSSCTIATPEDLKALKALDETANYKDGVYYGEGYGYFHVVPLKVKVIIQGGRITDISKVSEGHYDDPGYGDYALEDMITKVKTTQNINLLAREFMDMIKIKDCIVNLANTKGNTKEAFAEAFNKYLPGVNTDSIGNNMHVQNILPIIKKYCKNHGYENVDATSGATYSGKGAIEAIYDAVKRAKEGTDIKDFTINEGFRKQYVDEDLLDLSNLSITVTKQNDETENIPYSEFEANGFTVKNHETGEDIQDKTPLSAKERGLYLSVVHKNTGSKRIAPIIYINNKLNTVTLKNIIIRKSGSSNFIETRGFSKDANPLFNQTISIDEEAKATLIDQPIEIAFIVTDKDSNEHTILLKENPNQPQFMGTLERKTYSGSFDLEAFKKEMPGYKLPFSSANITIDGEVHDESENIDNAEEIKEYHLSLISVYDELDVDKVNSFDIPVTSSSNIDNLTIDENDIEDLKDKILNKKIKLNLIYSDAEGTEEKILPLIESSITITVDNEDKLYDGGRIEFIANINKEEAKRQGINIGDQDTIRIVINDIKSILNN